MKSFDIVFQESENQLTGRNLDEVFKSFRDQPGPYHFLTATKTQYWHPDTEALEISNSVNQELTQQYLKKEKPLLGYSSKDYYVPLDHVDSRHIMMSTIIFSTIGKEIDKIVEIGSGFGNWIRLNTDIINYNNWTMIDLDFVSKLQKWYVSQTVKSRGSINYVSSDTEQYNQWLNNLDSIDLVIGAHSLSEFSLPVFEDYFNSILPKTKYFFYATHNTQPSKSLVYKKLEMINNHFNPIVSISSQHGKVSNILFQRKDK
jgi:hypothetical protein